MSKSLSLKHPEYDVTSLVDVVNDNGHAKDPSSTPSVSVVVASPEMVPGADVEMARSQKASKEFSGKSRSIGSSVHERQKIVSTRYWRQ